MIGILSGLLSKLAGASAVAKVGLGAAVTATSVSTAAVAGVPPAQTIVEAISPLELGEDDLDEKIADTAAHLQQDLTSAENSEEAKQKAAEHEAQAAELRAAAEQKRSEAQQRAAEAAANQNRAAEQRAAAEARQAEAEARQAEALRRQAEAVRNGKVPEEVTTGPPPGPPRSEPPAPTPPEPSAGTPGGAPAGTPGGRR